MNQPEKSDWLFLRYKLVNYINFIELYTIIQISNTLDDHMSHLIFY